MVKLLIRPAPPTGPGPMTASGQVATRHEARRSYASSSRGGSTFEQAVEVSGNVAGEAAFDLSAGLAFGSTAGDVVAGGWLVLDPALDHGVQCVVEVAVAVAVESVAGGHLESPRV